MYIKNLLSKYITETGMHRSTYFNCESEYWDIDTPYLEVFNERYSTPHFYDYDLTTIYNSMAYGATVTVDTFKNGHKLIFQKGTANNKFGQFYIDEVNASNKINPDLTGDTFEPYSSVSRVNFCFIEGYPNGNITGMIFWTIKNTSNEIRYRARAGNAYYSDANAEILLYGGVIDPPEDPYGLQENDTPPGGYSGFDYNGDDVNVPALPTISAANSGFVRLYNPTITEVQDLADYLWAGAFDIATYKKLFGNPMDCFLSFGIIPVTPARSETKQEISFANMPDPGVSAYKVTSQFAEFDCGSVTIDGSKYTGSAMDYSPYTRAEIFLPFCGTHSLSIDEIMDATVGVVYHMDLYTGACVAYVKITRTNSDGSTLDSVLYQFTGNILATIPLTGADHSSFIQSILFMGAAAAATVATAGGAAPEIGGAMAVGDSVSTSALGGAAISASGINAVMSMKPNVIRSGNLSANAGFLGLKKPVITLTLPNLCRPADENKLTGMPCQKSGLLSDFTGFNIVSACHLDNIPCTKEELRMIDEALAKGVIL